MVSNAFFGAPRRLWAVWIVAALLIPALPLLDAREPSLDVRFGDAPRYYAYAEAMLGRPYDAHYIRLADAWRTQSQDPAPEIVAPARPLLPWRDFLVEYPPGALIAFLPPALFATGPVGFSVAFGVEMAALLTLALMLGVKTAERLRKGAGKLVLGGAFAYLLAGPNLLFQHYDALVALTLAVFAHAVASNRPLQGAAALAAGIVVKGSPALLIPVALIHFARSAGWRRTAAAGAFAAAILVLAGAAYLALAGAHAADMFDYQAMRPLQIQSLGGAAALAYGTLKGAWPHVVYSFGSYNLDAAYEPALRALTAPATVVAALAPSVWRALRGGLTGEAATRATLGAGAAVLIGAVTFGKVFSPQYVVWLAPLALVAAAVEGRAALALTVAAVVAGEIEYPLALRYLTPLLGFASLARAALWLAAGGRLLGVRAPQAEGLAPSGGEMRP